MNLDIPELRSLGPDAEVIWKPWPKQWSWISCPIYEQLAGGAKGPGKSDAAIFTPQFRQHVYAHKHWMDTGQKSRGWALIIRKSFPRLKDIAARCHDRYTALYGGAESIHWSSQDHTFTCAGCGYKVELGHLDSPDDHLNYHGREFTALIVDQCEEVPYEQYAFLKVCVRTSDPILKDKLFIFLTSNPGGLYGQWVKDRFQLRGVPTGNNIIEEWVDIPIGYTGLKRKVKTERIFMPGRWFDNPSLNETYIIELSLLPPHLRDMMRDGNWDAAVGQYFADVWDANYHIIPRFKPPKHMPLKMGGDWGTTNPAAVTLAAITNDDDIIIFDELYQPGSTGREFGDAILRMFERNGLDPYDVTGWMDPGAWNPTGTDGPSPGTHMNDMGILWEKADRSPGSRVPGWTEMRERMRAWKDWKTGKVEAKNRRPGIAVTENCTQWIRSVPSLLADTKKPNDIDTSQDDHLADATRYLCSANPVGSSPEERRDQDVARWISIAKANRGEVTESSDISIEYWS